MVLLTLLSLSSSTYLSRPYAGVYITSCPDVSMSHAGTLGHWDNGSTLIGQDQPSPCRDVPIGQANRDRGRLIKRSGIVARLFRVALHTALSAYDCWFGGVDE